MGLDAVELVLAVEDEFAITIDDKDAEKITTPRQFADYVVGRLGAMAPGEKTEWTSDPILQRIIQITSEQLGVPIEKVLPDSHFVEDLGMN